MSETIVLRSPLIVLPQGPPITVQNAISFNFNYTLSGGSFSITVLKDSITTPVPETVIISPNGRQGIIKNVSTSLSRNGLLTVLSGILVPPYAQAWVFVALANTGATPAGLPANSLNKTLAQALLSGQGIGVTTAGALGQVFSAPPYSSVQTSGVLSWLAEDFPTSQFFYRGEALAGVQQLAKNMLAEVVVRNDKIIVIEEGAISGNSFTIPFGPDDIVSLTQEVKAAASTAQNYVIDPGLTAIQEILPLNPIYDSQHCQIQGLETIQVGNALNGNATGAGTLPQHELPNGWFVDGEFVDFDPTSIPQDPNTGQPYQQFWKIFNSPVLPGYKRGITHWTRIVKDLKLSGNIAKFVGFNQASGGIVNPGSGYPATMSLGAALTNNGPFVGFNIIAPLTFFDVVTNQNITIKTPLVLTPPNGADSGTADVNYYDASFQLAFFPLLPPYVLPGVGVNPVNPYNVPQNTAIVTPPSQILRFGLQSGGNSGPDFYTYYLPQYKRIQNPRLRTACSFVYRGEVPLPGDSLTISNPPPGVSPNCGRIEAVTLLMSAQNISATATAEVYNYSAGPWPSGPESSVGN